MDKYKLLETIEPILKKEYKSPNLGNKEDPIQEIIFITLSNQTLIDNAIEAFNLLLKKFPEWQHLINAPEGAVEDVIKIVGPQAKQKEGYIREILQHLTTKKKNNKSIEEEDWSYLGKMSNEDLFAWLTEIPNVGPKTANCVMLFSFGRNVLPVDRHVHRVLKRLELIEPKSKLDSANHYINKQLPESLALSLHTNIVEHGRRRCKDLNPICSDCCIKNYCAYAGYHPLDESSRYS